MDLKEKVDLYLKAKDAYFNSQPIISDMEFDMLEMEIEAEAPNHPALSQVGSPTRSSHTVQHRNPMLSTEKALTVEALVNWAEKRSKEVQINTLVATAKLDGMSCELRYVGGFLVQAVSRGDGEVGADITAKVRYIAPTFIDEVRTVHIRGELVMKFADFEALNKELPEPLANPRNGVAGLINEETIEPDKLKRITFMAYELFGGSNESFIQDLQELGRLRFKVPLRQLCAVDGNEAMTPEQTTELFNSMRANAKEPWDGVVFRIDNKRSGDLLGSTAKFWKYMVAWKFNPEEAVVHIREIQWQQGTRDITPVITFDPVELDGAVIQRASGKSVKNLITLEAFPGNTCKLVRSGGVIPWLQKDESTNFAPQYVWEKVEETIPEACPECGDFVELTEDFAHLTCRNARCGGALARQVEILAKAMDIKYMGPSVCKHLVENGFITRLSDITILEDRMLGKPQDGIISRLLEEIRSAKERIHRPEKILGSVGVYNVGVDTAKRLLQALGSLDKLLDETLNAEVIAESVDRFSLELARKVHDGLVEKRGEIQELINNGIKVGEHQTQVVNIGFLSGKVVVVTGALEDMTRKQFKTWLEDNGAKLGSGVSSNTDFLVANNPSNSSKFKKAESLGVEIISQKELMARVGQ